MTDMKASEKDIQKVRKKENIEVKIKIKHDRDFVKFEVTSRENARKQRKTKEHFVCNYASMYSQYA